MSPEIQNTAETQSARLARECLEAFANQQQQEEMLAESSPKNIARDFYTTDCPDKVLLPAEFLDSYRLEALSHLFPEPGYTEEERRTLAAEQLEEVPTQDVFPWLHYSTTGEGYVVDAHDLEKVFKADEWFNYPDKIETEARPAAISHPTANQSVEARRQALALAEEAFKRLAKQDISREHPDVQRGRLFEGAPEGWND